MSGDCGCEKMTVGGRSVVVAPDPDVELRRLLYPAEVAFVLQTAGRSWLDWRYPA